MLNVSQKEKKCVRYLACEMLKAERSVFEIEMSLDDDLRAVFENFKTIWINYPSSELPERTISFEEILNQYNKPEKLKSVKVSIKKKGSSFYGFPFGFLSGPLFHWNETI